MIYKLSMQLTDEIKASLKREYTLCSNAVAFYKKALKELEHKHHITTQTFLRRFEAGKVGDEADYFDWYAFAKLLSQWKKTQLALHTAVQ
ncbi:MAG TPA: hypothetical protein VJ440_12625 [Candidatus Brocadiaceae bacterium]|nr:hypothetical protein [Candidatus Brocadiaceae bacterium]